MPILDGVNDFETLKQWLSDDLGDIEDPAAWRMIRKCAEPLRGFGFGTEVDAIQSFDQRLANQALKDLFTSQLFTRDGFEKHRDQLRSGEALAKRLRARNPLPTLDALVLLDQDPRSYSQCERAALLTCALVQLHAEGAATAGAVPLVGTCLVPGEEQDSIANSGSEISILVLADGVPFLMDVEPGGAPGPADFEAILSQGANSHVQISTSLLTAASRRTCWQARQAIEADVYNRETLARIDRCLFAVCLDSDAAARPGLTDLESTSQRLFTSHANRWYGMTNLVIDVSSEAGLIASYNRGMEARPVLAFSSALWTRSLDLSVAPEAPKSAIQVRRCDFRPVDLGDLAAQAEKEIESSFHRRQAFFELPVGVHQFRSLDISPNAGIQYLLMLALQSVSGRMPTLSQAVSTEDGAGLKGGLDWMVAATPGAERFVDDRGELSIDLFRKHAALHASKVKAARAGYSPAGFIEVPPEPAGQALCDFFISISRYQSGYRSYLFRAMRKFGPMDMLVSNLRLPSGVRYCGRPGATVEVATMTGAHVVMEETRTRVFYIPHHTFVAQLPEFHRAAEQWCAQLLAASTQEFPWERPIEKPSVPPPSGSSPWGGFSRERSEVTV